MRWDSKKNHDNDDYEGDYEGNYEDTDCYFMALMEDFPSWYVSRNCFCWVNTLCQGINAKWGVFLSLFIEGHH